MKTLFHTMFMLVLLSGGAYAESGQSQRYGGAITLKEPVSVQYAVENFMRLGGKELLLEGTVTKVCEMKGCWMGLRSADSELRVTFKNYGFFVSPKLIDRMVWAQGRLHEEVMTVGQARHFARDAGLPESEVEKITQPVKEYRFVATAVEERP